jgi:hypothetical protein
VSKKISIIGRGTAGAISALHFQRWLQPKGYEIEWVYDPSTPTQAVGEGSALPFPRMLHECLGFTHSDLAEIDGTMKLGIYKENWTSLGESFRHTFPPPAASYHFNALRLQDYIHSKIKDKVSIVERNITDHSEIDSPWIMDCTGAPKDKPELLETAEGISVNSVHVTQCYWDSPRFQETLTIARPYGWVFGIPLQNRCSIGYMYNKDINTLEEVKEDVKVIFEKYNLTPSDHTNTFSFKNYFRKKNFDRRVAFNGNASFFLEPMEATSISTMDIVNRQFFDIIDGNTSETFANMTYDRTLRQIQGVIAMHYINNKSWENEFWAYAKDRSLSYLKTLSDDEGFSRRITSNVPQSRFDHGMYESFSSGHVGTWEDYSFAVNMHYLKNQDTLLEIFRGENDAKVLQGRW